MTLLELKEMAPTISWDRYFGAVLMKPIHDDELITVLAPSFIKDVEDFLKTVDKRVLANYMVWRAVFETYRLLSTTWMEKYQVFYAAASGQTSVESRDKYCIGLVRGLIELFITIFPIL